MQHSNSRIHRLMNVPVPWVFVLAYLAGVALQHLAPPPHGSPGVLFVSHVVGTVLMVVGVLLAVWSQVLFRRAHTTTVPFETASTLLTVGPYQFSRNPMYISLTLVYLGEAGLLGHVWPLLFLFLTVAYVHRVVIPVEEARLREVFRADYEQYCRRVRRWL